MWGVQWHADHSYAVALWEYCNLVYTLENPSGLYYFLYTTFILVGAVSPIVLLTHGQADRNN